MEPTARLKWLATEVSKEVSMGGVKLSAREASTEATVELSMEAGNEYQVERPVDAHKSTEQFFSMDRILKCVKKQVYPSRVNCQE